MVVLPISVYQPYGNHLKLVDKPFLPGYAKPSFKSLYDNGFIVFFILPLEKIGGVFSQLGVSNIEHIANLWVTVLVDTNKPNPF